MTAGRGIVHSEMPVPESSKEKTYVVFVGRKPGVYGTWEEVYSQVNKFNGASHKSFIRRDEALKAFNAFMEKRHTTVMFTTDKESSSATSIRKPTHVEKLAKLKVYFQI